LWSGGINNFITPTENLKGVRGREEGITSHRVGRETEEKKPELGMKRVVNQKEENSSSSVK